MTLFLPVGPPGAGKTTLAKDMLGVGAIKPDAIVCPDDYRVVLTGEKSQEENDIVFNIVNKVVMTRLRRGLDVWVDATNLSDTRVFRRTAEIHNHEIYMIKLKESDWPNILKMRNANRPVGDRVPDEVLNRFIEKWNNFQFPEGVYVITEEDLRLRYGILYF